MMTYFCRARKAPEAFVTYGRRTFDEGVRRPRLVLTGGPACGKTTILRRLRREFGSQIVIVPEVISVLEKRLGFKFPGGDLGVQFDAVLAGTQAQIEYHAEIEALRIGARLVVMDRGVPDKAAYMPGGLAELEHHLRTLRAREWRRYDRAVLLDIPPPEIFDRVRARNKVRREESWEHAKWVHDQTVAVWRDHPNLVLVGNDGGMRGKFQAVRAIIDEMLCTT